MRCLNPTTPVLPIGVFRHFRAAASVHSVTSPNKLTVNGRRKSKEQPLAKQGGKERFLFSWLLYFICCGRNKYNDPSVEVKEENLFLK